MGAETEQTGATWVGTPGERFAAMVTVRDATAVNAPSSAPQKHKIRSDSFTGLCEGDADRLRKFAAFDNFSDHELLRLVRAAHHDSVSAPWPLIYEQTPSDACYILLSGEVGVYVGRDHIATLGPGEVIGESALRRGKLRSATVTTTGPAEVLRITLVMISQACSTSYLHCGRSSKLPSTDTAPKSSPSRRRNPRRSAPD